MKYRNNWLLLLVLSWSCLLQTMDLPKESELPSYLEDPHDHPYYVFVYGRQHKGNRIPRYASPHPAKAIDSPRQRHDLKRKVAALGTQPKKAEN